MSDETLLGRFSAVGALLRAARRRQHLSLAALSHRLGESPSYSVLARYERGELHASEKFETKLRVLGRVFAELLPGMSPSERGDLLHQASVLSPALADELAVLAAAAPDLAAPVSYQDASSEIAQTWNLLGFGGDLTLTKLRASISVLRPASSQGLAAAVVTFCEDLGTRADQTFPSHSEEWREAKAILHLEKAFALLEAHHPSAYISVAGALQDADQCINTYRGRADYRQQFDYLLARRAIIAGIATRVLREQLSAKHDRCLTTMHDRLTEPYRGQHPLDNVYADDDKPAVRADWLRYLSEQVKRFAAEVGSGTATARPLDAPVVERYVRPAFELLQKTGPGLDLLDMHNEAFVKESWARWIIRTEGPTSEAERLLDEVEQNATCVIIHYQTGVTRCELLVARRQTGDAIDYLNRELAEAPSPYQLNKIGRLRERLERSK